MQETTLQAAEIRLEEVTLPLEEAIPAGVVVTLLVEGEIHFQEGEADLSVREEEILRVGEETPSLEADTFPMVSPHSLQDLRVEGGTDPQEVGEEFLTLLGRVTTETSGIFGNTYLTEPTYQPLKLN